MSDVEHDNERRIREKAYALWEADGRPDGQEEQYWAQACKELAGAETASVGNANTIETQRLGESPVTRR